MRPELLKGNLEMLLLAVIEREPLHGYGVIERLREMSSGVFDLQEGTIYPALHQMEDKGLLSSKWSTDTARRRRVYAISQRGRTALADAESDWRTFSAAVRTVMTRRTA